MVSAMQRPNSIHPTIDLDLTVELKNESELHWAIKSAIVNRFRSDQRIGGRVEIEKKTADLIADIRCQLGTAPDDIPSRFVVEIQTTNSAKDFLRTTATHLRHGYAVYWVFDVGALSDRENAETELSERMSSEPSLGVAALEDGELSLGAPITWSEFEFRPPLMGEHELYVPTYDRSESCYDHGDFVVDGNRVTVYRVAGEPGFFISQVRNDGQQTLPMRASWTGRELQQGIESGDIQRISPVRGPP